MLITLTIKSQTKKKQKKRKKKKKRVANVNDQRTSDDQQFVQQCCVVSCLFTRKEKSIQRTSALQQWQQQQFGWGWVDFTRGAHRPGNESFCATPPIQPDWMMFTNTCLKEQRRVKLVGVISMPFGLVINNHFGRGASFEVWRGGAILSFYCFSFSLYCRGTGRLSVSVFQLMVQFR